MEGRLILQRFSYNQYTQACFCSPKLHWMMVWIASFSPSIGKLLPPSSWHLLLLHVKGKVVFSISFYFLSRRSIILKLMLFYLFFFLFLWPFVLFFFFFGLGYMLTKRTLISMSLTVTHTARDPSLIVYIKDKRALTYIIIRVSIRNEFN